MHRESFVQVTVVVPPEVGFCGVPITNPVTRGTMTARRLVKIRTRVYTGSVYVNNIHGFVECHFSIHECQTWKNQGAGGTRMSKCR